MLKKNSNKCNNLALIIQGPINSRGINFKNNKLQDFHSFQRVVNNIKAFKEHSDIMILSTYENELTFDEITILKRLGVKIIENKQFDSDQLPLLANGKPINVYKQFYTLLTGIDYLLKEEFTGYIIKLRTDIELDVDFLVEDLRLILNHNPDAKFMIPFIINRRHKGIKGKYSAIISFFSKYELYMFDFYFCGEIRFLQDIITTAMNKKFALSAHHFLIFPIIWKAYFIVPVYQLQKWRFHHPKFAKSLFIRLLETFINIPNEWFFSKIIYKTVYPLSKETLQSLKWRESGYYDWKNINLDYYEYID